MPYNVLALTGGVNYKPMGGRKLTINTISVKGKIKGKEK